MQHTAKELKELAKQRGIKYFSRMSKKKLCEVLGVELQQKPTRIVLINTTTKETLEFPSIYKAAKDMDVNPGLIIYYISREMKIGDEFYYVNRV